MPSRRPPLPRAGTLRPAALALLLLSAAPAAARAPTGADARADLALLKIDATGLSHLPLTGDHLVRQGELVFAIGSPQGLSSTITMGVAGIIPPLQIGTGVVVAARALDGTSVETGLQVGDVIHPVDRREVGTVEALRTALDALPPGAPVALQIERQGKLAYLAFDME